MQKHGAFCWWSAGLFTSKMAVHAGTTSYVVYINGWYQWISSEEIKKKKTSWTSPVRNYDASTLDFVLTFVLLLSRATYDLICAWLWRLFWHGRLYTSHDSKYLHFFVMFGPNLWKNHVHLPKMFVQGAWLRVWSFKVLWNIICLHVYDVSEFLNKI